MYIFGYTSKYILKKKKKQARAQLKKKKEKNGNPKGGHRGHRGHTEEEEEWGEGRGGGCYDTIDDSITCNQ